MGPSDAVFANTAHFHFLLPVGRAEVESCVVHRFQVMATLGEMRLYSQLEEESLISLDSDLHPLHSVVELSYPEAEFHHSEDQSHRTMWLVAHLLCIVRSFRIFYRGLCPWVLFLDLSAQVNLIQNSQLDVDRTDTESKSSSPLPSSPHLRAWCYIRALTQIPSIISSM